MQHPLVFIHIPKTAGSSIINELWPVMGPRLAVQATWVPELQRHQPSNIDILAAQAGAIAAGEFDFIHGHFTRREMMAGLGLDPKVRLVTFLRDPVERVASEYYYVTSPTHPGSESLLAQYPTLEHFIEECAPVHNTMHRYLAETDDQSPEDTAASLWAFDLVGRVETYDEDYAELMRLVGTDRPATLRYNVGPARATIPPGLRSRIETLNEADAAVYSWAASSKASLAA